LIEVAFYLSIANWDGSASIRALKKPPSMGGFSVEQRDNSDFPLAQTIHIRELPAIGR
jgi:hypothetical protein